MKRQLWSKIIARMCVILGVFGVIAFWWMFQNESMASRPTSTCSVEYMIYDGALGRYTDYRKGTVYRNVSYGGTFIAPIMCPEGYFVRQLVRNGVAIPASDAVYDYNVYGDIYYVVLLFPVQTVQTCNYYIVNPETLEKRLYRKEEQIVRAFDEFLIRVEQPTDPGFYLDKIVVDGRPPEKYLWYYLKADEFHVVNVYWYPNGQRVSFSSNGGIGKMPETNFYYDCPKKLPKNTMKKEGYTFVGWSTDPDYGQNGSIGSFWQDEEIYNAWSGIDGYNVKLYAVWRPSFQKLTLIYHGECNGEVKEYVRKGYSLGERFTLWDNESEKESSFTRTFHYAVLPEESGGNAYNGKATSKLLGWAYLPNEKVVKRALAESVEGKTLADEMISCQGYQHENEEAVLHLYAVWDDGPKIIVPKVYVGEDHWKNGMVEEKFLHKLVKAFDKEDGKLEWKDEVNSGPGIYLDRLENNRNDCVCYCVRAFDLAGNESEVIMECELYQDGMKLPVKKRKIRFISLPYLGTLSENSIWRVERMFDVLKAFLGIN